MSKIALSPVVLGAALAALLSASPAAAAPTKVWVSNAGANSAACGAIATPCLTFQQAHDNVAAGGEIGILTPGDYGALLISKAVSIINESSGEAGISGSANNNAIAVDAGVGSVVGLRGLTLDGRGVATQGILIVTVSALHIQNCVIRNFESQSESWGILHEAFADSQIFLSDTIIFNNGGNADTGGILLEPQGTSTVKLVLDRVHLENNVVGIRITGFPTIGDGARAVMRDSVVSGNASHGIQAFTSGNHGAAFITVERSLVTDNAGTGVLANGPRARAILGDTTIFRNGTGVSAVGGGQVNSFGNNRNNNNIGAEGVATNSLAQF